jgi:hypothetical protein
VQPDKEPLSFAINSDQGATGLSGGEFSSLRHNSVVNLLTVGDEIEPSEANPGNQAESVSFTRGETAEIWQTVVASAMPLISPGRRFSPDDQLEVIGILSFERGVENSGEVVDFP